MYGNYVHDSEVSPEEILAWKERKYTGVIEWMAESRKVAEVTVRFNHNVLMLKGFLLDFNFRRHEVVPDWLLISDHPTSKFSFMLSGFINFLDASNKVVKAIDISQVNYTQEAL